MIAQDDAHSEGRTETPGTVTDFANSAKSVTVPNNPAAGPQEPPAREYAFNLPPLGDRFGRPAGFFADERESYQGQMILGQGSEMGATGATLKRSAAELGGVLRPSQHPQVPTSRDGAPPAEAEFAGVLRPGEHPQEYLGVPPAEMSEDMARLIRASTPPPPNGTINSVEDLLEVVHVLPVVEIFRRMKHLKASRIRRMLDSRKFREHMDLRRRLAWEKATTEAAVVVPAAVDRLYWLTLCEKPETARKSCMALVRMGRPVDRKAADRGTVDRVGQSRVAWPARRSTETPETPGTVTNFANSAKSVTVPPGSAPFRLVPPGAVAGSDDMCKSNFANELSGDAPVGCQTDQKGAGAARQAAGRASPVQVNEAKTARQREIVHAKKTATTGPGAVGLRQSFMEALEARLRKT